MPLTTRGFWANPVRTLALIWISGTLILSLLGPFGTFQIMGFSELWFYWGGVIAAAIVLVGSLRIMVIHIFGRGLRPFQMDAILLPLFTILFTPPLQYFTANGAAAAARETPPFSILQTGMIVVGVTLILIVIREMFQLNAPGVDVPDQANPPEAGNSEDAERSTRTVTKPLLFERLPDHVHGELMAISGSDHYVEVRTAQGTASILLRFADALREIEGVRGQRVHRSHWVADAAVVTLRRDGNRRYVVLQNGDELPVSRTYEKHTMERWGEAKTAPI